ncbi:MAG: F0F1 ATP synthase subunit beta, partial [Brevefilum sp.]
MNTTLNEPKTTGIIIRAIGVVVDVEFETGDLPSIHHALTVVRRGHPNLILEVQEHVDAHTVRTVALGSTEGLQRGLIVEDTGFPITVPVGRETLGRMFNILGEPIDGKPPLSKDVLKHPI